MIRTDHKKFHIYHQGNVFNIEEPSMSYLQLPTRNAQQEDSHLCTRCGKKGHWRCYCQVSTWYKFCTSGTHLTQACRRYANFVKDNLIACNRRMRLVQEQRKLVQCNPINVNVQQQEVDQKQLFPHPPTQRFQPLVVPPVETRNIQCPLQQ